MQSDEQRQQNSLIVIEQGMHMFGSYARTNHCFAVGNGARTEKVYINFQKQFTNPPHVQCSIGGLDTQNTNQRIDINPTDISAHGFLLNLSTWENSKIYYVKVNWIAVQS